MPESNSEWPSDDTRSAISDHESAATPRRLNDLALECFVPAIVAVVIVVVAAAGFHNQTTGESPPHQQARDVEAGETRRSETAVSDTHADNPGTTPKPYQAATGTGPADPVHRAAAYRPYGLSIPRTGPAVVRPAESRIIEQQQRAYELAEQARRQHWNNVEAYRAAVEQRIRQERAYRLRQRHDVWQGQTPGLPESQDG